jgi:hypothetical protein
MSKVGGGVAESVLLATGDWEGCGPSHSHWDQGQGVGLGMPHAGRSVYHSDMLSVSFCPVWQAMSAGLGC